MYRIFDYVKIQLASPSRIRNWCERILPNGRSVGEIVSCGTLHYRTLKPEMGGLLCERVFGSFNAWECHCGEYKGVKETGIICEKCGVEPTDWSARRHRMGYVKLSSPVIHVWFLKSRPSKIAHVLGLPVKQLEDLVYRNSYVVTATGSAAESYYRQFLTEEDWIVLDYQEDLRLQGVVVSSGAEAVKVLISQINLLQIASSLRTKLSSSHIMIEGEGDRSAQIERDKILRRLRVITQFLASNCNPSWMVLEILPVLPPELRPMFQLDTGQFMSSDLNDLYRRVVYRNGRLRRINQFRAPELVLRNDKRLLQEAIDALLDNGMRGRPIVGKNNRPLKSLSERIRGKQGRLRHDLLGKRVDYSARSVIITGPDLRLTQCGIPREMAIELFKVFVAHSLLESDLAGTLTATESLLRRGSAFALEVLKDVMIDHVVLLNRAPTLHRMGIQAFEPLLVDGRAILLHPLVCSGYNADFDGDQMAVHVPLSVEAQTESRFLLLAPNNFLSPATGHPNLTPSQDMVLGSFYLTADLSSQHLQTSPRYFSTFSEVLDSYNRAQIGLQTLVWVRFYRYLDVPEKVSILNTRNFKYSLGPNYKAKEGKHNQSFSVKYVRTTPGRIIFNSICQSI